MGVVVNAADPAEALFDGLAEMVTKAFGDADTEGTGCAQLSNHLVCFILGIAAVALLDLKTGPAAVGEAVADDLRENGVPPFVASLAGAVTTKVLSVLVAPPTAHLALVLCAATVAWCPDEDKHPDEGVMVRCTSYIDGQAAGAVLKVELG